MTGEPHPTSCPKCSTSETGDAMQRVGDILPDLIDHLTELTATHRATTRHNQETQP